MLFHSFTFIFIFLPAAAGLFHVLRRQGAGSAAQAALVGATIVFFSLQGRGHLTVLLVSLCCNCFLCMLLSRENTGGRSMLLWTGIALNVALLGLFKYAGFIAQICGSITGTEPEAPGIVLPVAISFYTFQQIACLADCYRGTARCRSIFDYVSFVLFFPYLIAGPITRFQEIVPQLRGLRQGCMIQNNLRDGLFLFCVGLAKKVLIADTLALWADRYFDATAVLTFVDAWTASLSYTFQLYFDFSGYSDMAIGCALVLGFRLPLNFNSPYKARDLRDFWSRWHMTLTRFLRDYIYIPLGGSRCGEGRTLVNTALTFFICGLWHGAGWTFILWGLLHGAGLIASRLWKRTGMVIPPAAGTAITFLFVNVCWVLFRARGFADALKVLSGMCGMNGIGAPGDAAAIAWLAVLVPVVFFMKNSTELLEAFDRRRMVPAAVFALALCCLQINNLYLLQSRVSSFLYFAF